MLDLLAIGAHPDDCEIFMGGTLAVMKERGLKIGVLDLTRGELGTYGSVDERKSELEKASRILGLDVRETLSLPDGGILNNEEQRLLVIEAIRKYPATLIFTFGPESRHPDHRQTHALVKDAVFLAGLEKIKTVSKAHKAKSLIFYPEFSGLSRPNFAIDITSVWKKKCEAIMAYDSQVLKQGEDDPTTKTFIRSGDFWKVVEARAVLAGQSIGVSYAEPFISSQVPNVVDLLSAFGGKKLP